MEIRPILAWLAGALLASPVCAVDCANAHFAGNEFTTCRADARSEFGPILAVVE
jgi:hypothetical protein